MPNTESRPQNDVSVIELLNKFIFRSNYYGLLICLVDIIETGISFCELYFACFFMCLVLFWKIVRMRACVQIWEREGGGGVYLRPS